MGERPMHLEWFVMNGLKSRPIQGTAPFPQHTITMRDSP